MFINYFLEVISLWTVLIPATMSIMYLFITFGGNLEARIQTCQNHYIANKRLIWTVHHRKKYGRKIPVPVPLPWLLEGPSWPMFFFSFGFFFFWPYIGMQWNRRSTRHRERHQLLQSKWTRVIYDCSIVTALVILFVL